MGAMSVQWRMRNGILFAASEILSVPFSQHGHTTVTKETKNTHNKK